MNLFENLWCLFNAPLLQIAATFAVLGGIVTVIVLILSLPPRARAAGNVLHTPIDNFNSARGKALIRGWATIGVVVLATLAYFATFFLTAGKTSCDEKLEPATTGILGLSRLPVDAFQLSVILLYLFSLLAIILFGLFYLARREAVSRHNSLSGST